MKIFIDWLKQNWFKLIVAMVLIWVAWNLVGYLNYNSESHPYPQFQNYAK
jgi:hypothetical protein